MSINPPVERARLNVAPPPDEQQEIVKICNRFKQAVIDNDNTKKETMRTCYAYVKNQFVGGDLLPIPSTIGSNNSNDKNRPQVFIPVVRQQIKQLYSYLKLTILPNEDGFFRVKGKNAMAAQFENDLTEALKYKFREIMLTEKIGESLFNVCWAGNSAVIPAIKDKYYWEWQYDEFTQQYIPYEQDVPPEPTLEVMNPLAFYVDPNAKDPECAKWCYLSSKKLQEIKDDRLFFNIEELENIAKETNNKLSTRNNKDVSEFNGLQSTFNDVEKSLDYDLFYFPHLKTSKREYRNMLIGVAGEQVLIRFHPNMFPKGLNPCVYFNWMPDADSAYGTGPAEDIKELQRLINILYNYMVEVLARIGNRFVVGPDVDMSNLFGVAGGVARAQNPGQDVVALTGDYGEVVQLANIIGTAKAEAQVTSGSQNPFQGSSNVDFKKTATELQILQENSISVIREVIEHISVTGIQRILERMMYLYADLYDEPVQVRVEDPKGARFLEVDLSVLKSGNFTIELVSVNPSQSKQAQVNALMQLMELVANNPQGFLIGEPVMQQILQLQGIKDHRELFDKIKQLLGGMMGGATQPGVPGEEVGMGVDPQQVMAGVPEAVAGEESTLPPA